MGSQGSLHYIDYCVILISVTIPILITFRFSRKQVSAQKYFTAQGRIPSWAISMSFMATLISSITFLAYPGEGFSSNWIRMVQNIMVPVTLFVTIGFIVPLYRKYIRLSAYEYFEQRFGPFARFYTSLSFVLNQFSGMGTVFFLLAMALGRMTGLETLYIIWALGLLIVLLTMLGGMEAIIWIDVSQGLVLIGGGILALIFLVVKTDGGLSAIWQVARDNGRTGFGPYDLEFVNLTVIVMALNGFFYAIKKYGTDQTVVQRYLTARSDKEAVKAVMRGIFISLPIWALFMFIGTSLFAHYHIRAGVLPVGIENDAVFPFFILNELPVGVVGIIVSALIAAGISSLTSDLNSLSAVFIEDYFNRVVPNTPDKTRVFMGKLFIVLSGLGAIGVAMLYVNASSKGVLATVFTLYAIFSGGIAGLFLLGIFSRRTNKQGAYIGIAASVLFTGYAVLTSTPFGETGAEHLLVDLGQYNFTHHPYMIGVYSHLVLMVVGYGSSFLFKGREVNLNLTYHGWKAKRAEG